MADPLIESTETQKRTIIPFEKDVINAPNGDMISTPYLQPFGLATFIARSNIDEKVSTNLLKPYRIQVKIDLNKDLDPQYISYLKKNLKVTVDLGNQLLSSESPQSIEDLVEQTSPQNGQGPTKIVTKQLIFDFWTTPAQKSAYEKSAAATLKSKPLIVDASKIPSLKFEINNPEPIPKPALSSPT